MPMHVAPGQEARPDRGHPRGEDGARRSRSGQEGDRRVREGEVWEETSLKVYKSFGSHNQWHAVNCNRTMFCQALISPSSHPYLILVTSASIPLQVRSSNQRPEKGPESGRSPTAREGRGCRNRRSHISGRRRYGSGQWHQWRRRRRNWRCRGWPRPPSGSQSPAAAAADDRVCSRCVGPRARRRRGMAGLERRAARAHATAQV